MRMLKILPLMCLVATAFAIRVPLCRPRYGQKDGSAESNETCLCATGSPTIINKIDAEHFGVERLVIFVYRKPNTGEIMSFIPEREYQRRIPDFSEDHGITENISYNPSILDIFDNSPSKDVRQNNDTYKPLVNPNQPSVIDTEPKGLDPPQQDVIPHWQIPVTNPSEVTNIEFPQWQIPDKPPNVEPAEDIQQAGPGNKEFETKDIPTNDNVPFINSLQDPPIYETPGNENVPPNTFVENLDPGIPMLNDYQNYDYPTHPVPQNTEGEHYPGIPMLNDYQNNDYPTHPVPQNTDGEHYPGIPKLNYNQNHDYSIYSVPQNTEGERYPETNRDVEHDFSEANPNSHAYPLNPADNPPVPYHNYIEEDRNGHEPSNIVPSANRFRIPLKDKDGNIIGWTSKTFWANNWNKPVIRYKPNNLDSHGEQVPSFDYWLKQQLKQTTLHGNVPTSTSDIVALLAAIRNLLLQNGFVVTTHGTLTDGYGKVTSLANLKLRPIFIGKSFSYNHFMQGGGSFEIPTDSPFLQGLLLTMIKPAKILGIVPMKITSLPDELSPKNKHKLPVHGHGNPDQKASFKVLPIEDLVAFRKYSKIRRLRPHSSKKHKDAAFLHQAMSEISKPRKVGHVRDKELEEPEKGTVSKEKPDFRIIGGASATSSGIPLLFKGRSGLS